MRMFRGVLPVLVGLLVLVEGVVDGFSSRQDVV